MNKILFSALAALLALHPGALLIGSAIAAPPAFEYQIDLTSQRTRIPVFRGEFVKITFDLADPAVQPSLAELPDSSVFKIGATGEGAEVRWVGPATIIYRAPAALSTSRDKFVVRGRNTRGLSGINYQSFAIAHDRSLSSPAEQVRLKAEFYAAPPTVLLDGRGIKGSGPDPRVPVLEDKIAAARKALAD